MGWEKARREQGLDHAQEIHTSGPGELREIEGMPMAEYREASLQPCVRCGRDPREAGAGTLHAMRVVNEVIVADTLCVDCMTDDERATYEAVLDEK